MMKTNASIYIHIPFCNSKCYYCNFVSAPETEVVKQQYVKVLCKEIEMRSKIYDGQDKITIKTIYFGGGTPTTLNVSQIAKIFETIKQNFYIQKNAEISIEANPNTVTYLKLKQLKNIGFNRISFGVQSLDDTTLKKIGRTHTKQDAINAIKNAVLCGFTNINADILLGLPNQTKKTIENSILELVKSGVTHISAYMLILEENTPLFELVKKNAIVLPTDDQSVLLYNFVVNMLKNLGYKRYEISNFAKVGYECKHNLAYWNRLNYFGFGLSSCSLLNNTRLTNTSNMKTYLKGQFVCETEVLTKQNILEEIVMLSLRTAQGINLKNFKKITGENLEIIKESEIMELKKLKLIIIKNNFLFVNPKKFGVTNQIIFKLV
ncbi:MAG: radical SAM family heme chaperone HemW [Clostridia bacterium]